MNPTLDEMCKARGFSKEWLFSFVKDLEELRLLLDEDGINSQIVIDLANSLTRNKKEIFQCQYFTRALRVAAREKSDLSDIFEKVKLLNSKIKEMESKNEAQTSVL